MTSYMLASASSAPARRTFRHEALLSSGVLALCTMLGVWMSWDRLADVWHSGAFYDTDDAMRAVQLRDWLAGQDWFDLRAMRMDPPGGMLSHWSRVVDVPLAGLTLLGRVFLVPDLAERFARIAFPALLIVALYAAVGSAAATLAGQRARIAGIVLAFLGAPFLGQFIPGRIDHHAPQILLLVLMVGASLAAFDPGEARKAAAAGCFAALSLAISLENLPFILVVAAAWPLSFALRGAPARDALAWFALGLAASLIVLFFATVTPSHLFDQTCDAYSIAHLAGALGGCGALLLLWFVAPRLASVGSRLLAVALVCPLPVVAVVFAAPRCLGDPFVGLDPLVRDIWLHNVAEVEPLTSFVHTHPSSAITLGLPCLFAIAAALVGAVRGSSVTRARFALLACLLAVCLATTLWGIRVFSSGLPLIAIVGASVVVAVTDGLWTTLASRLAVAALASLPFAPLAYALALPPDPPQPLGGDSLSCLTPAALAPLAGLPPGLVLAPIDAGAHLLAFTPHSVIGGPYHRNNHGNRLVFDALLAAPQDARRIVETSGATYVAICPDQVQARIIAQRAPQGFAADLLAGRIPAWLERIPLDTPQQVYRIR
jgi:hypothetical protein